MKSNVQKLIIEKLYQTEDMDSNNKNILFVKNFVIFLLEEVSRTEFEKTNILFDILSEIHGVLSWPINSENRVIPPILKRFLHDFERIDDWNTRRYIYEMIKEGNYTE